MIVNLIIHNHVFAVDDTTEKLVLYGKYCYELLSFYWYECIVFDGIKKTLCFCFLTLVARETH